MVLIALTWAIHLAQASFFPSSSPESGRQCFVSALSPRHETLFNSFQDHFYPLVKSHQAELRIIPRWDRDEVSALAKRPQNDIWEIQVFGGLLKDKELSDDEIMLILCHELGHHLGGPPLASKNGWSASEGQADYWSGIFCRPLLHQAEEAALSLCEKYALDLFLDPPQKNAQDASVVKRTFYGYPRPQCRLDTIRAGIYGQARPACWFKADNP